MNSPLPSYRFAPTWSIFCRAVDRPFDRLYETVAARGGEFSALGARSGTPAPMSPDLAMHPSDRPGR